MLSVFLLIAICLKFFPPKKPNFWYGYQGNNAKKNLENWKIANQYSSTYMLISVSFLLPLSIILDYLKFDSEIILFVLILIAFFLIFYFTEKKLK